MSYAQKSFSPFLESRRRAARRRMGLPLTEPRETDSRRLLETLAQDGPTRVSALLHRSEMDPIPLAAMLQSLKKAGLISVRGRGAKGGQLVGLTSLGQEMTAE